MNYRITLISLFNEKTINIIDNLVKSIDEPLCKVPFIKDLKDRISIDTLPFHITLYAWNIKYTNEVIELLNTIKFKKIKVKIDQVKIKSGREDSFVLYLSIEENIILKNLQEQIYAKFPSDKYNPQGFTFHITIHVDKDYEKIIKIKNQLDKNFESFEIEFDKFGLFEIYPAKQIW